MQSNHKSQKVGQKKSHKRIFLAIKITAAAVIGIIASTILWYNVQLSPIGDSDSAPVRVTIVSGSSSSQIAILLQDKSVIRSSTVFKIYTRLIGKRDSLKAGTYSLSPSYSTQRIVDLLVDGSVDTFNITFYPGATIKASVNNADSGKTDVTNVLSKAGYSSTEIQSALSDAYSGAVFEGKPAGTDLEGYVFGETYRLDFGVTAHQVLQRSFDELYAQVQQNNIVEKLASHGLNLYQGITLASIVQREAGSAADQKQVAQVFYSRLNMGMALGSDVTYQYIADKLGIERDVNIDSPYNTRRYGGLPPGPISSPGLSALLAVAEPAAGDYLYFLSGDDDVTYFANTNAEHEANVLSHCQIKCSTP